MIGGYIYIRMFAYRNDARKKRPTSTGDQQWAFFLMRPCIQERSITSPVSCLALPISDADVERSQIQISILFFFFFFYIFFFF